VVLEVPAPQAGVLSEVLKNTGDIALSEEVLARIDTEAAASAAAKGADGGAEHAPTGQAADEPTGSDALSPAVQRLVAEHKLDASAITGTGKGGRLIKGDVLAYLDANKPAPPPAAKPAPAPAAKPAPPPVGDERG